MESLLGTNINMLPQASMVIIRPTAITLELPSGAAYYMPVVLTITPDIPAGVTLGAVCRAIHSFYQGLIGSEDLLDFIVCKPQSGPWPTDIIASAAVGLIKQAPVQRKNLFVLGACIAQVGQRGSTNDDFYITLP